MKKLLLFLALLLAFALVSCGNYESAEGKENDPCLSDTNTETANSEIEESVTVNASTVDNAEEVKSVDSVDTKSVDIAGDMENNFVLEGIIKDINEHLEVEVVNSDYAFGLYWVLTFDETDFYDENGKEISRSDLKAGDFIEITYSGQVMLSYPPQIAASRIKIK